MDILEIENNLNLEILQRKREIAFKTEKRVNLVINEVDEELEQTKIFDLGSEDDGEEEKVMEESAVNRKGTDMIMRETVFGAVHKKGTIPYVRKKIFLRARARFADPPSEEQIRKLTFSQETALVNQINSNDDKNQNLITEYQSLNDGVEDISLESIQRDTNEILNPRGK